MPGRVELHLVDPVAEPVVRAQPGRVLVRLAAELLGPRRAGQAAEFADAVLGPAGTLTPQRGQHGRIVGDVVPVQRGRLVEYLVCRRHQRLLPRVLFRH
jgi:hypothetical protein